MNENEQKLYVNWLLGKRGDRFAGSTASGVYIGLRSHNRRSFRPLRCPYQ
ncbi:hypothetical protein ACE1CD_17185 [Aerosakkonema sp. BLCC-F183]